MTPAEARSLARLGLKTADDLLFRLPRWHVSRSALKTFAEAREGRADFFRATVNSVGIFRKGRLHIIKVALEDGQGGKASLYWFNRPYLASDYRRGAALLLRDAPSRAPAGLRFSGRAGSVERLSVEDAAALDRGEMVVYYRATTVITQERARTLAAAALQERLPGLEDPVPEAIRARHALPALAEALRQGHRPSGWAEWERARRRLAFDQLFLLQLALGLRREKLAAIRKGRPYTTGGVKSSAFLASLPFPLTGAQRRVIAETTVDLARESPMNRLLQGDVGSGKTVIAAAAIAVAVDSGYQAAVLAPTEILAEQHFRTFRRLLGPAGIQVGLLTGGKGKAEKKQQIPASARDEVM
ncbi:MAG: DEAD/DEAH box helicase, partial [bacterium]